MRRIFSTLVAAWLLTAVCSSCSGKPAPQVGGETHWLAACTQNEECGGTDLSCVCGTCTRACSVDSACAGGREAACFDPNSPLLLQRCEDRSSGSSRGLCLPRCAKDADCGTGRACVQRTCVPTALPDAGAAGLTASADAGNPAASADAGLHATDFSNVSDNVSWTEAVSVPAPQVTIVGADERILGTWNQANCDPTVPTGEGLHGCVSLVIERTDSGEVTGSLILHAPAHNPYISPQPVNGPFAPPTDPDVGYPTEVDPSSVSVGPFVGEVPYRMLDGRFDGETLSFAYAPYDLWHAWCQLQKPYPWEVGGHTFFFCVPQDETAQAGIDKGKLALCTTVDFQPLCSIGQEVQPCSCVGMNDNAVCAATVCHCDSQTCDADLHFTQRQFQLTLADGRLAGTWRFDVTFVFSLTLERVPP